MSNIPFIQLNKGFCNLSFGAHKDLALVHFGQPQEVKELNDGIMDASVVYHYWDSGYSLFFDLQQNYAFTSVEIDNRDTLLYDTRVFSLKEKELVLLMNEYGFALTDTEMHPWGEKRLSFEAAGLDCYFENNRLTCVNFSVTEKQPQFFMN